jgi:hypothetical protein
LERRARRADHLRVARPQARTLLLLVAALLAPLLWGWGERARRVETERRAGLAASLVAGREVQVRCPGVLRRRLVAGVNHGSVQFGADGRPADHTDLAGEPCAGLRRLVEHGPRLDLACLRLDACGRADTRVALGVAVLAHESVHLRGVIDEAATECEAIKRAPVVAAALGASAAAGRDIQDWQFSVAGDRLPERYRSSADCRVAAG